MSILRKEDSQKWVNAFVAGIAILAGYVTIRFVLQLGEWFDLEAKISQFIIYSQVLGVIVGLVTFMGILKKKPTIDHIYSVYDELTKVVWPDRESVIKVTIAIMIASAIMSGIFVLADLGFQKILELFY